MHSQNGFARLLTTGILAVMLASAGSFTALAEDKCETIDASAMGTSTQMGKLVPIKVRICEFSTQAVKGVRVIHRVLATPEFSVA